MNNKKFRFDELSNLAQIKAVYDYMKGWEETHGQDYLNWGDCYDILLNSDDVYKIDGKVIPDQWD